MNEVDFSRNAQKAANQPINHATLNEGDMTVVNSLFKDLAATFPAWRSAFKTQEQFLMTKKTWSKAFIENGVNSMEQVQAGLKKARSSGETFLPSVGQFVNWCKPTAEDFGMPEVQAAYRESCRNASHIQGNAAQWAKWSHDAVHVAAKATGYFDLVGRPERETFPLFKRNYEIVLRRVMQGEDLSAEIPKALPAKATSIPTEAPKAKANIAALKAMLRRAS